MNGSHLKLLAALALVGTLSGCASLSKSECLSADWEDIGVRDGANGRAEEYLLQHAKACAKVDVIPDRGAWQHGRERGLDRYCVPRRAYLNGQDGDGFNVEQCVNYDQERLTDAWRKGNDVHRLSSDLSSIDDEISTIHDQLENDEKLERKEREHLAFRLGQLGYERIATQRAYEDALERARDL